MEQIRVNKLEVPTNEISTIVEKKATNATLSTKKRSFASFKCFVFVGIDSFDAIAIVLSRLAHFSNESPLPKNVAPRKPGPRRSCRRRPRRAPGLVFGRVPSLWLSPRDVPSATLLAGRGATPCQSPSVRRCWLRPRYLAWSSSVSTASLGLKPAPFPL